YALAAALVSQYTSNSANTILDPTNAINNAHNQAVQTAIWYLTYNTDYQPAATWPAFSLPSGVSQSAVNYWINWAENHVSSVDLRAWAIISGPATAAGSLLNPTTGMYQTFLVQVASNPEPGFYGVLLVGLAGLYVAARRRKAALNATAA